jgi:hypothetical protein
MYEPAPIIASWPEDVLVITSVSFDFGLDESQRDRTSSAEGSAKEKKRRCLDSGDNL